MQGPPQKFPSLKQLTTQLTKQLLGPYSDQYSGQYSGQFHGQQSEQRFREPFRLQVGQLWKTVTSDVAGFFYPRHCLHCEKSLVDQSPLLLCRDCQGVLCNPDLNVCQKCSATLGPYVRSETGCLHCLSDNPVFLNATSLGAYSGELRRACVQSKLAKNSLYTQVLTQLLCETRETLLKSFQVDLVLPVPQHWRDRLMSATHGPDEIAWTIGRFLKVPADTHILNKVKLTPKQHQLTGTKRRQNLQGCFSVNPTAKLHNLRVLLVDDVLTTCTTANRLSQAILNAGAESVHVAILARTLHS